MGIPHHVLKGLAITSAVIFIPILIMVDFTEETHPLISLLRLLVMLAVGCFLYFLPSIIGYSSPRAAAIIALNFLIGWTVIGWIAALIWALAEQGSAKSKLAT